MKVSHLRYTLLLFVSLALLLANESRVVAAPRHQESDATLHIINDSDETICFVVILQGLIPVDELLGGNTIPPSENYSFSLRQEAYNNIALIDCDSNLLLLESNITISGSYELRFTGPDPCNTLNDEGVALYSQAQYSQALQKHQEALACYQEVEDRAGVGSSLSFLGDLYTELGRIDEGLKFFQQALEISREENDRATESRTLNNLGLVYRNLGRYDEALAILEQALEISHEIGNRAGEAATFNNIGTVYNYQGRYEEALAIFEQALSIMREVGYRVGEGFTLNGLGEIYKNLGRYDKALDFYQQALSIMREAGNRAEEGTAFNGLGQVYQNLGRYDKALGFYQQALEISREVGNRTREGTTLHNIGGVYTNLGHYDEALRLYQRALEISREVGDRAEEVPTLNGLGGVYESLGRYDEALGFYQQALEISREVGDRVGEGTTLNGLGGVYENLGHYDEALGFYQRALEISREVGDRVGEGTTLKNLGFVYERQERYYEALAHYQQSVEIIEQIRGNIKIEELKSSFTSERMSAYNRAINLLVQLERPNEAFDYVQRAKARTFLDQMGNVRINPKATNKPELVEDEQKLLGEIRALEEVLFGNRNLETLSFDETTRSGPPELTNELRKEVQASLEAKRQDYEQLLIDIKTTNQKYASLVTVDTLSLTDTQSLLSNGTTLVEYYVLPEQTLAFIVTADRFHTEAISVTQQMLFDEINRFDSQSQTTLEGVPSSVQTLYNWLVAPLEAHLSHENIIIAPHSVLHYVPFAGLHDGKQYLIEQHTLTQQPSASILPFVQAKRKENVAQPLILGDADGSLPNARQEAEAIAARYDGVAYVGSQAQEQVLWQQGQQAGIVHLSTHGIYNPLSPTFSRVLLAPDAEKQYDGFLEVHEVYNLDLQQADLVVLSACQTNLGQQSRGDEIIGLNRAFIYAGTPSVMATLWSVEDSATKDLMLAFYRYLDEGYSKGEALRQAQIDVLRNPDTAHPYFWAGVVLTGDGGVSTRQEPWLSWITILAVVGVIVGLVGGAYVYRKRRRTKLAQIIVMQS